MEETRTVVQPTVKRVKSTTLTPGRWIYVCPCGFRYTVCRVVRTSNKWMVYCFKCKQQTGKYYKVMDERLEFEENFNGKLNCRCFTTIRLHHPVRNAIGGSEANLFERYMERQCENLASLHHHTRPYQPPDGEARLGPHARRIPTADP